MCIHEVTIVCSENSKKKKVGGCKRGSGAGGARLHRSQTLLQTLTPVRAYAHLNLCPYLQAAELSGAEIALIVLTHALTIALALI